MSTNFNAGGPGQGPVARVFAVILGAVALAASFMFSLVVVAVLAVVALGVGLYFWWKTRALREAMRESIEAQQRAAEAMGAPEPTRRRPTVPSSKARPCACRTIQTA